MLIPALDLIDGQVVRLYQGDYQKTSHYNINPLEQALAYQRAGAQYLHLVDLTGAKNPAQRQTALLSQITQAVAITTQAGGGVRTREDIASLLAAGVNRVVIGSVAVQQIELTKNFFKEFGAQQIVLALDVQIDKQGNKLVATHGWQQNSGVVIEQVIEQYLDYGLTHILCTDIAKDGTLAGPNITLYKQLKQQYPQLVWQASGGISQLTDFTKLKPSQVDSVIVGRALLENKFTLEEAMQCWQNA